MPKIDQRYATAVQSSDLGSDPKTTRSDSDVLGAMALADRTLTRGWRPLPGGGAEHFVRCPLAAPLARLLAGDNGAAKTVVEILAKKAHRRSHVLDVRISFLDCKTMAVSCLAWFRDGTCRLCGGHGKLLIPGTVVLGNEDCQPCYGTGKVPFSSAFRPEWRVLAMWLAKEMDRALGRVGPVAMAHLAPQLEL